MVLIIIYLLLFFLLHEMRDTHTHINFMVLSTLWDYPGEPVPEPIWILLEQETVSGSVISWAILNLHLAPDK